MPPSASLPYISFETETETKTPPANPQTRKPANPLFRPSLLPLLLLPYNIHVHPVSTAYHDAHLIYVIPSISSSLLVAYRRVCGRGKGGGGFDCEFFSGHVE